MIDSLSSIESSPIGGIELSLDFSQSDSKEKERQQNSAPRVAARENTDATGLKVDPEKQDMIRQLQQRDQEVRTHEAAHQAAGGASAGGASFTYQKGPDGQMYAIGGSVSIDASSVPGDPEATLEKARQVKAAALAPANPSGQDMRVAASASQMEAEAQVEKTKQETEEKQEETGKTGNVAGNFSADAAGDAAKTGNANAEKSSRPEAGITANQSIQEENAAAYAKQGRRSRQSGAGGDDAATASPAQLSGAPSALYGASMVPNQYFQAQPTLATGAQAAVEGAGGAYAAATAGSDAVFRADATAAMRLSQGRDTNALVVMQIPQSARASERATRAYERQLPPTSLAPMGTGFSLSV